MSEPHGSSKTTVLLGIAALGATTGLCGIGGLAGLYLNARSGGSGGGYPPPPGNPKGAFYEQPDTGVPDAGTPDVPAIPLPANPKGSFYDDPLAVPAPTPPPEPAPPAHHPGTGIAGSKP